jgi:hypothetical protein
MPPFEDRVHGHFDERMTTLGKIKSRSLGADSLTLTALNVLVYAQLQGGIKDLASCVLRDLNLRHMSAGEIKPDILKWRNPEDIGRFKAMVDFDMIANASPFASALSRRIRVRGINRRAELNQMSWEAVARIYRGLGLDPGGIEHLRTRIDEIVDDRNAAAHHGALLGVAVALMERHVRDNVFAVETVLTHFSLQVLPFFANRQHER